MSEELKWGMLVVGFLALGVVGIFGSCNHQMDINSKAPIVETCVKHPVTAPPFRAGTQ